jgi:predicted nuclease with TOPRIM domain
MGTTARQRQEAEKLRDSAEVIEKAAKGILEDTINYHDVNYLRRAIASLTESFEYVIHRERDRLLTGDKEIMAELRKAEARIKDLEEDNRYLEERLDHFTKQ